MNNLPETALRATAAPKAPVYDWQHVNGHDVVVTTNPTTGETLIVAHSSIGVFTGKSPMEAHRKLREKLRCQYEQALKHR